MTKPAVLDQLSPESGTTDDGPAEITLDANSVILVGERAAGLSGTFSACQRLAERTGARLAWVPRRAGDRGAVEAGCLPNLLPGGRPVSDAAARVDTQTTWGVESVPSVEGRDADEILIAAADGELEALVVAGVDPNDFVDPQAALEGLEAVSFMISVETRASLVTERANVVFPVSLMQERAGTFVNWEGRRRSFEHRDRSTQRHVRPQGAGRARRCAWGQIWDSVRPLRLARNSTSWGAGKATASRPLTTRQASLPSQGQRRSAGHLADGARRQSRTGR